MPDPAIAYGDVQGTILRGYRVDLARHFILSITDAPKTGVVIGALVDGADGLPRITTAARWTVKPECFVNLAFTAAGLTALGVTAEQLSTFDAAFQRGAASSTTANIVGDVGASAPANWIGGLSNGAEVHAVLSLWVDDDPAVLEAVSIHLRAAFAGCVRELSSHDAKALPHNMVHFGYRDGIAQPTVVGAPPRKAKHDSPDDQPAVATGEFLLGYTNETPGVYSVQPSQLSTNSSYAAFRILEQDIAGFEAFLAQYAAQAGIDVETLAAKVCGRWRNGNPLMLVPDGPAPVLPSDQLNDFTYVGTGTTDDTLGLKCPIGSHIRRNNPRNEAIVGAGSPHHRIVRRGMPYGPPHDPAHPDTEPRGLIGYFINASLTNQFEFLTSQWDQASAFVKSATDPTGTCGGNAVLNISGQDVFLGINDPSTSSFTLAACGGGTSNKVLQGFSRFVITRGGAYVFLPSITGLRYLAGLAGSSAG
jgi:Dyp-type peroxidase family